VLVRLELGTRVEGTDGTVGVLVDLVVDPVARRVTHLVVEPRRGPGRGLGPARLVPVELAESGDEGRALSLRLTAEEVEGLPPVDRVAYVRLGAFPVDDPVWDVGTQDVLALPYYTAYDPRTEIIRFHADVQPSRREREPHPVDFAVPYDRVPKDEVEIRRTSSVTSADGHRIGSVDGFVVDRDGLITHLVLEHGHLFGRRDVAIPIGAVDAVETDAVTLSLTRHMVGALPEVPVRHRPPPPPPPPPRGGRPAPRPPARRRP
jgi:sporulation protein YlmC with PRC-barrel domain